MEHRTLRQRLARGAQAQAFALSARVVMQIVLVGVLVGTWGLDRYGDWLILSAVTQYFFWGDVGFIGAAQNELTMAVGRGDRPRALVVYQAVSTLVTRVILAVAILLSFGALIVPVADWLNLSTLGNGEARAVVVIVGLDLLVLIFGGLLYGAFASVGRYGEGALWGSGIYLLEYGSLGVAVLAGADPPGAAGAMLAARVIGTVVLFAALRRRVPWLRMGRQGAVWPVLRPLVSPALASGAVHASTMVATQGMVLVLGLAAGPASAAIFATLRTVSRTVIQLLASLFAVITPELSRAFGEGAPNLVRTLHRRASQVTLWAALSVVAVLAVVGDPIIGVWTSGEVDSEGAALYILLAAAVVGPLWHTSFAVLYSSNTHQRAAACYVVASILSLPLAYVLVQRWGLNGAALAVLALEAFMVFPVLRQALPAAHDNLLGWLSVVWKPPLRAVYGAARRGALPLSQRTLD